ncbi:ScbA/BarX family gamma-butyrolactone biosynthesis protein [Nocardia asteroides]|uniref:ScbA/BarX family gamma-butyrolactone biosynthesis protein n=1 Tax=Nocardia asteroides TaxID=1824 RepID=UPI001E610685|nr:ScbA/BarX family gamma-butyrolactone biosynthesis protein [Nocardia asteroides]UGT61220.1 gamma-butyrolactone biosynthesis protein [Nocardia asteroides]
MSLEAVVAGVSHQQPIRRELTHRAAVAEVFVTSLAGRDTGGYLAGAQLPRMHAYYGDHTGAPARLHDPLLIMETARQASIALTHEFFGAPLDSAFLVRTFNGTGVRGVAWECTPDPTNLVLAVDVPRVHHQAGAVCGMDMILEISCPAGPLMTVDGSFSWTSPDRWSRLRSAFRQSLELPPAPGPTVAAEPVPPGAVGRENRRNVIVGAPEQLGAPARAGAAPRIGDAVRVPLAVDPLHPFLFDHHLDHVPGSVLLEAARQSALTLLNAESANPQLLSVTSRFDRFAELDLRTECRAEITARTGDLTTVRCVIAQEATAAEIELTFLDGREPG